MNDVVPDWLHREDTTRASGTALPNTIIGVDNAELIALRNKIAILESEKIRLIDENAELREKCMTRFERIKNASAEELAQTLMRIYLDGYADGADRISREPTDTYWIDWLQRIGEI